MDNRKLDGVESRLNRIEGQIKAIKRMYGECKECGDIVQQIQAARAALAQVSGIILTNEAVKCVEKGDTKEFEKVLRKTFKV